MDITAARKGYISILDNPRDWDQNRWDLCYAAHIAHSCGWELTDDATAVNAEGVELEIWEAAGVALELNVDQYFRLFHHSIELDDIENWIWRMELLELNG